MQLTRMIAVAALIAGAGLALHMAHSEQLGIKRTALQQHDLNVPGREVVQVRVDFAPGAAFPRHTHPGEEIGYLLEGTVTIELDGVSKTLKAGDTFAIPAGKVHNATNTGTTPATIVSTYIIEKGKPLATPAK